MVGYGGQTSDGTGQEEAVASVLVPPVVLPLVVLEKALEVGDPKLDDGNV